MDDANLSRRQTVRVEPGVAYAQAGVVAFDGPIDLQALRLYGLPEAAPAVLNGTPLLSGPLSGSGGASSRQKCRGDLPSLAAGATALLDATTLSNNTVRSLTRNVSNTTIDLARPPYRYRL
jgi:hypothetical protein